MNEAKTSRQVVKNNTVLEDIQKLSTVYIAFDVVTWSSIIIFVITVFVGVIFNDAALVHKFAVYNTGTAMTSMLIIILKWNNISSMFEWQIVNGISILSVVTYIIPFTYIIDQITVCHSLSDDTKASLLACEGLNSGQECYPAAAMGTVRANGCLNVTTSEATSIAVLVMQLLQLMITFISIILSYYVIRILKDARDAIGNNKQK